MQSFKKTHSISGVFLESFFLVVWGELPSNFHLNFAILEKGVDLPASVNASKFGSLKTLDHKSMLFVFCFLLASVKTNHVVAKK